MDATPSPLDAPVPAKKPAAGQFTPARIVLLVLLFVAVAALLYDLVARKRYDRAYQNVKNAFEQQILTEKQQTPQKVHELIGREPDEPLSGKAGTECYTYRGIFYKYQVVVHFDETGLFAGIEQKQKSIFGG